MKLKYKFEIIELDDEIIAVPIQEGANVLHGVIKLNSTGHEIFNMLKEDTTKEEIISTLSKKYDASSKEEITEYVDELINSLQQASLLV